jgi:syntaxin 16
VVETIVELATIMRDLSTLIVEQGTMLDRVDHNITETAMKVGWGWGCGGGAACKHTYTLDSRLTSPPQHVTNTRRQVKEGTKDLVKAEQTQKSGRAVQCIALLLVLIVVFLIITIVRHA